MLNTFQLLIFSLLLVTPALAASDEDDRSAMELTLEETQAVLLERVLAHGGLEADDIEVVSAEARTWPDASLGCPSMRRMLGRSGPTPGYRFVLKMDGVARTFHSDRHGRILRCDLTQKPLGPITN